MRDSNLVSVRNSIKADMRSYKRKTDRKNVTDELYDQLVQLRKAGLSFRKIGVQLKLNECTVRKALKRGSGSSTLGRFKKVFTKQQEKEIVDHCKALDSMYYGLTLRSLRHLLYDYAEKNSIDNRFNKENKLAGRDFTRDFLKRNSMSLRVPRKISVARTMAFNKIQISKYLLNLEEVYKKFKFPPNKVYNMDETGLQTTPNRMPKHVAPVGKKDVSKTVSAEQGQTVTVVCSMSATGHYVPPFFIFKRKRLSKLLINNGPTGCDLAVTKKGYMDSPTFILWLDHFAKYVSPTKESPVLLILDNHVSHVNYEAVSYAKKKFIHMLSLPPHTSHRTQPLDRCFFKPLKSNFDTAVDNWLSSHPGEVITVYQIAEIFKIGYEKTATIEKATEAFKATGIFPLDINRFTEADFLPSKISDQVQEEEDLLDDEEKYVLIGDLLSEESTKVSVNIEPEAEPGKETSEEIIKNSVSISALETTSTNSIILSPVVTTLHSNNPGASTTCSSRSWTSPEDIIPLPKLQVRRKRSGRGLKSVLLTSTPHVDKLKEEKAKKIAKVEKQKSNTKNKSTRKLFKPTVIPSDDDSLLTSEVTERPESNALDEEFNPFKKSPKKIRKLMPSVNKGSSLSSMIQKIKKDLKSKQLEICEKCKLESNKNMKLFTCDNCPRKYHECCLGRSYDYLAPDNGDFICPSCLKTEDKEESEESDFDF